jgi:hypothetical protein
VKDESLHREPPLGWGSEAMVARAPAAAIGAGADRDRGLSATSQPS